ncbi:hypothetical protein MCUN1_001333 [Malassezia cuniculi]|uniref:COP9 signalosome complex subunit 2 n=1 Tax=Malassezia cuniculi TaxID=948313 RepID=A0AAF0EXF3_9BASI|nr:hypothetical protein MCUN1_001333 [Malassezia cuniculi]
MSDTEFMLDDAMEEDYDFEYEDDEDEDMDADADVENRYYNAKVLKVDDADAALGEFQAIVDLQTEMNEWGFKALKQKTKINFHRGRHDDALRSYRELLKYTKSAVTRNYGEKSINNILDYVSASSAPIDTVEEFYRATHAVLDANQSDRLNTKTKLKLARLWLAREEWSRLTETLRELRNETPPDTDSQTQGTTQLELLAIEIQMYRATGNLAKVKETYGTAMRIRNAIPHPRTMGIIRESGGKMHMAEKQWEAAQVDFFQAFRNYDEAGSPQRLQVLKYLILAHMLMGTDINPFDSQETKPYRDDPNIVAMTALVDAYQRRDIIEAERIIEENHDSLNDEFIQTYISDLFTGLRTQHLLDFVKPYASISLTTLAERMRMRVEDTEALVASQILNGNISARIDQPSGTVEIDREAQSVDHRTRAALSTWSGELHRLASIVASITPYIPLPLQSTIALMQYLLPAIISASGLLVNAAPVSKGHDGIQPLTPPATYVGGKLVVQWNPDTSGSTEWKNMDISLVSKDNKHVQQIATGIDGTSRNNNTYIAQVPSGVSSGEHYVQFSHDNKAKKLSQQFEIVNEKQKRGLIEDIISAALQSQVSNNPQAATSRASNSSSAAAALESNSIAAAKARAAASKIQYGSHKEHKKSAAVANSTATLSQKAALKAQKTSSVTNSTIPLHQKAAAKAQKSASKAQQSAIKAQQSGIKSQHRDIASQHRDFKSQKNDIASQSADIASQQAAIKAQSSAAASAAGTGSSSSGAAVPTGVARVAQAQVGSSSALGSSSSSDSAALSGSSSASSAAPTGSATETAASSTWTPNASQLEYAAQHSSKNAEFQKSVSAKQAAAISSLNAQASGAASLHRRRESSTSDSSEPTSSSADTTAAASGLIQLYQQLQSILEPSSLVGLSQQTASSSPTPSFSMSDFGQGIDSSYAREILSSLSSARSASAASRTSTQTGARSTSTQSSGRNAEAHSGSGAIQGTSGSSSVNSVDDRHIGSGSTTLEDSTSSRNGASLSNTEVLQYLREQGLLAEGQSLSDNDLSTIGSILSQGASTTGNRSSSSTATTSSSRHTGTGSHSHEHTRDHSLTASGMTTRHRSRLSSTRTSTEPSTTRASTRASTEPSTSASTEPSTRASSTSTRASTRSSSSTASPTSTSGTSSSTSTGTSSAPTSASTSSSDDATETATESTSDAASSTADIAARSLRFWENYYNPSSSSSSNNSTSSSTKPTITSSRNNAASSTESSSSSTPSSSKTSSSSRSTGTSSSASGIPLAQIMKNANNGDRSSSSFTSGFGGPSNVTTTASSSATTSHSRSGSSSPTSASSSSAAPTSVSLADLAAPLQEMIANGLLSNTGLSQEQISRFLREQSENYYSHSNTYTEDHYRSLSAHRTSQSISASF